MNLSCMVLQSCEMAVNLRFDNDLGIESAVGSRCTSSDVLSLTDGARIAPAGASIAVRFAACGIFGQNTQLRRTPPAGKPAARQDKAGQTRADYWPAVGARRFVWPAASQPRSAVHAASRAALSVAMGSISFEAIV